MEGHSVAVEATSYALLTYVAREGVGIIHERIVQWLTSVRVTYIGYFSTVVSYTIISKIHHKIFLAIFLASII
jgi:hypothetical protein